MIIDPAAPYSADIGEALAAVAPVDYPAGDLRAAHERGEVAFLTFRTETGSLRAVVAYVVSDLAGRQELRVVGLASHKSPFLVRTALSSLENMLAGGGRIVADIETDGMARLVESLGMKLRALTYVKDIG